MIIFVVTIMKKRILVAPLNWGLGHATRCIPIIKALLQSGFIPVLASDSGSLLLLQKEFPELEWVELPSYKIQYPEKGANFKLKMLWQLPKIWKAVRAERSQTEKIIKEYNLTGIISDNRLGVYSREIPSVILTHQLNVLTGNTTWLSSKIHQAYIKNFDECWVPDVQDMPNLSGKMGHVNHTKLPVKYIGILSNLSKKKLPLVYDLMILLSGPEPQRSLIEKKLLEAVKEFKGTVLFVKGKVEAKQQILNEGHVSIYNFMTSTQIEQALNESKLVIARSGYSTLMDLASLGKKAFLIPTPGQFEQEYLAERLAKKQLLPGCRQDQFDISKLADIDTFHGISTLPVNNNLEDLFRLFEGKRKF